MPATRYFDLTGKRFGKLVVEHRLQETKNGAVVWSCICDCGNKSKVITTNLKNGTTNSCGCIRKIKSSLIFKTHGLTNSKTYRVWSGMKTRCLNKKSTNYSSYGGRGITICERWNSFTNFLEDMGERPEGMTLDRIDVNGNYEPSNCRWASKEQQAQNKRKLKMVNADSFLKFLKTQPYLTELQVKQIVDNFFNQHQ